MNPFVLLIVNGRDSISCPHGSFYLGISYGSCPTIVGPVDMGIIQSACADFHLIWWDEVAWSNERAYRDNATVHVHLFTVTPPVLVVAAIVVVVGIE